jgi:riboflavin kinase/FMN adenylyltransferase
MKVVYGVEHLKGAFPCFVATVGNFDGVHFGHRRILDSVKEAAGRIGCASLLITFNPHPASVLYPARNLSLLTRPEKKLELLQALGLDAVLVIDFSLRFAQQAPRDFVTDILLPLQIRELYIGHDFAFGSGRSGNAEFLMKEGEKFGFGVFEIGQVTMEGDRVGSSRIRAMIEQGDVEQAARLLGRHHSVAGTVATGAGRGVRMGFPTCNLDDVEETIPAPGVYVTRTLVSGVRYGSVTHIGAVPTFNVESLSIESHIFDFNRDIHGETVEVFFIKKLRDTVKYDSADSLVRQIRLDCQAARETLEQIQ